MPHDDADSFLLLIKNKTYRFFRRGGLLFFPCLLCPALTLASATSKQSSIDYLLTLSLDELTKVEISLATGSPKSIRTAPAVASVITAKQIEEMGAATLDEALETVPGLHVIPSNFNRLNSSFSIRGISTAETPQVLVLLDNIPITLGIEGNKPNTFNMSTANIARIEVVRGPGSALYGADAFAGTINIITKDALEINGAKVGARADSFGATDTWLQYGGQHNGWDVAMSFDFLRSDGDNDRMVDTDQQTALDTAMGTTVSFAPGHLETDDQILDAHLGLAKNNWTFRLWNWSQLNGGEGAGGGQALDPTGREKQTLLLSDLIYRKEGLVPDLDLAFGLNYKYAKQDSLLRIFPPGALLPIGADGNINFANPVGVTSFPDGFIGNPGGTENHYAITMNTSFHGLAEHILQVGTGFQYIAMEAFEKKNFGPGVLDGSHFKPVQDGAFTDVTGTPYIFVPDVTRELWHVLLQDEWGFARDWELTAGLRYDRYSDFGGTFNPRLALVWTARADLTAKLLYGSAFRPPSFKENYYINNPLSLGNPNLTPETIDTLELAFEYKPSARLLTKCNLFAYEINDLIDFVADPGQTSKTAQNAKDQQGRGFEIEADWLLADSLRLRSNFAYQRSEDKSTGAIVPDVPEMQFYANLHWKFLPAWSLDTQYFWIGKRHRASDDMREGIKDNDIVNLTVRRKAIARHWDVALAVRNLFNEDVREPSRSSIPNDYPMQGRNIWAEARYVF